MNSTGDIMKYIVLLILFVGHSVGAQNLNEERIWKIAPKKKAIYLASGVFHQNAGPSSSIIGIRSSSSPQQGYERVVIDFSTAQIPKIYGHISEGDKKISVDFLNSSVSTGLKSLSKYQDMLNR
jgi:hypothetical protein